MRIKVKKCSFVCLVVATAFLFSLAPMPFIASAQDSNEVPTWEWSSKHPKPDWWTWGDEKNKPVRGGYLHVSAAAYIGLMNPNH